MKAVRQERAFRLLRSDGHERERSVEQQSCSPVRQKKHLRCLDFLVAFLLRKKQQPIPAANEPD
jgi:hypothetical protein